MINKLLTVRLNNVHKDEQKTLKTYLEENCWDWTVTEKETVVGSFCFKSITIANDNDEKMYLCTWNDGDIVQVHTEKTLRTEYEGTNLFDVKKDELVNNSMFNWCTLVPTEAYDKAKSLDEVFKKFNDEENYSFVGYTWQLDNCKIERIK